MALDFGRGAPYGGPGGGQMGVPGSPFPCSACKQQIDPTQLRVFPFTKLRGTAFCPHCSAPFELAINPVNDTMESKPDSKLWNRKWNDKLGG